MSIARNRKNILTFLQKNPPYSASCTYKWLSRVTCLNGVSQKIRHYIDEETKPDGRARHTKEVPESELPKTHKDYVVHTRQYKLPYSSISAILLLISSYSFCR